MSTSVHVFQPAELMGGGWVKNYTGRATYTEGKLPPQVYQLAPVFEEGGKAFTFVKIVDPIVGSCTYAVQPVRRDG